MDIMSLLQELANNVHHSSEVNLLLNQQSDEVKQSFLTNDVLRLKKILGETESLADRDKVVQITNIIS